MKWFNPTIALKQGIILACLLLAVLACERKEPPPPPTSDFEPLPSGLEGYQAATRPSDFEESVSSLEPPATTQDADIAVPPFRPLADARIGEWARYRTQESYRIRYEVVAGDEQTVTIETEVSFQERPVGRPTRATYPRDFDPLALEARRNRAQREAFDGELKPVSLGQQQIELVQCQVYIDLWTSEDLPYRRRTVVASNLPVWGTWEMVITGGGEVESHLQLDQMHQVKQEP